MCIRKNKICISLFLINIIILEWNGKISSTLSETFRHRIIGGKTVYEIEDTKYVVSIRLKLHEKLMGFGRGHICGGSLIKRDLVLTAAHCLIKPDAAIPSLRHFTEFTVVMGILDLYNETSNYLQLDVKILVHKKYTIYNSRNDIALMFLKGSVPENDKSIIPIQLARESPKIDTECSVSGWGITKINGSASQYLMRLEAIPLMSKKNCTEIYKEKLLEGMMCAGFMEGGKDTCLGDSGGPLVCNNKLVAVVSWGSECARANYPGVYTDLSYYNEWIHNNMFNNRRRAEYKNSNFVATIYFKSVDSNMIIIAGGALISSNSILTTAHSLYYPLGVRCKPEQLSVLIGNRRIEDNPSFRFDVANIKIHENFTLERKTNNIAILKLSNNITKIHRSIEIANLSSEVQKNCITYGFNAKQTELPYYHMKIFGADDYLHFSKVEILPNKQCKPIYSNHLENDWICAGDLHSLQDENQPEEGGPLICNGTVVGLAWNISLIAIHGYPSRYVDAYKHRDWVLKTSANNCIDYGYQHQNCVLTTSVNYFVQYESYEENLLRFSNLKVIENERIKMEYSKHLVSIRSKEVEKVKGFGFGHICSGALIKHDLVLASSCCLKKSFKLDFTVVMGILNLYDEMSKYLQFDVKKIIQNKFCINNPQNDIALMFLKGSVSINHENIIPIPLAKDPPKFGTKCRLHNWGGITVRGQVNQLLIMIEKIPLISETNKGTICKEYNVDGNYSCLGESGGPLVCDNKLVGLVSWGSNYPQANYPGVYIDLSYYNEWIHNNMFNNRRITEYNDSNFVATIRLKSMESNMKYIASGVLINSNTILTTAHSLYYPAGIRFGPEQLSVIIGNRRIEDNPSFRLDVVKIIIHDNFNLENKINNIAMLKLTNNITKIHRSIEIANLSNEEQKNCITLIFNEEITEFSGHHTKFIGIDDYLLFSFAIILPNEHCKPEHSNHFEQDSICADNLYFVQDENQLKHVGPLLCNGKLVGLAWNHHLIPCYGCPSKYTDVYKYRNWVLEMSNENNVSPQVV